MPYMIYANKDGKSYQAIPMKHGSVIGRDNDITGAFDTREEAENAFEEADGMQIPALTRNRRYMEYAKNASTISYEIKHVL